MKHFNRIVRIALIASGALAATPALLQAQTPDDQSLPPPDVTTPSTEAAPATTQIADAKVDQFAAAFVAVQQIQAQASQQLDATADEQQAAEVKSKAEKQMIEAVEREGLQVEEFNRIADLIAADMTLRSRVLDKVQKRTQGG